MKKTALDANANMIVYLVISSFMEIGSIGAEHYYGELVCWRTINHDDIKRKVDLLYTLKSNDAKRLNKKAINIGYHNPRYKAGEKFPGFNSRNDIIALAKATYKEHFPDATVLILGNPIYSEPQTILDAPDKCLQVGKELLEQADKIGRWANEKKMLKICRQWNELLRTYS